MLQSSSVDAIKFLFDSEDLLETGLAIVNENMKQLSMDRYMGIMKLNLNALDLEKAINKYSELSSTFSQFGMDESNSIVLLFIIIIIIIILLLYKTYNNI